MSIWSKWSKSGIVNVKMVITEEKVLSNIAKVQKMIDPNSKKQIIQLEDDAFFKDLVESIKTYLIEYPKKKNFPKSVYKAAYGLVEFATNEFEENTKRIEDLIRQREINISLAAELKGKLNAVLSKEQNWKEIVKGMSKNFSDDIIETLGVIGRAKTAKSDNYQAALKLINARIANLESNLHIEIDMERIEDRSKALSYIGIEVADALKLIPTPQDLQEKNEEEEVNQILNSVPTEVAETNSYYEETRVDVKPSLWERIKQSKLARAIRYITRVKIVLDVPALPSGEEEKK